MSDEPNKLVEEAPPEPDANPSVDEQAVLAQAALAQDVSVEETEAASPEDSTSDAPIQSTEEADAPEAGIGEQDSPAEEETAEEADAADEIEPEETEEEETEEEVEESAAETAEDDQSAMDWYILKVQSNRERSIADALRRKIAIEGLDSFFGEVIVPMEKVTEFKGGKKKVVERKLYPGYIVVNMHINDDTWFAVRETSGIGDFTGSGGKPTPMLAHEVARIIQTEEEETDEAPKLNIAFKIDDRVKVKEGNFESFEGEVSAIDQHSGRITVMINIFGRSTPVELEYWQVDQI